MTDKQTATKHDSEKPRMGLLPPDVLILVAKVFTYGARKYSAWNWTNGFAWSRLYDAAERHLSAWNSGETVDPESGLPHLGHAACCVMMLAAHELRGLGQDDRHDIARRLGGNCGRTVGDWRREHEARALEEHSDPLPACKADTAEQWREKRARALEGTEPKPPTKRSEPEPARVAVCAFCDTLQREDPPNLYRRCPRHAALPREVL